jgi:hypothetical protein
MRRSKRYLNSEFFRANKQVSEFKLQSFYQQIKYLEHTLNLIK